MVRNRYLILTIFFLIFSFIECRKKIEIDFYAEKVFIELRTMDVRVTGEYFFENATQSIKYVKFFYPFPVDSFHYYPDTILLDYPFDKDTNGIYFVMKMGPGRENSFKITYSQKLKKRYFRYITTTTRKWGRPIMNAEFVIIAPKNFGLKINYKINKIESYQDKQYCRIIKKKFFPEEDLFIEW